MGENLNRRWQNSQARGAAGEGGAFDALAGRYAKRKFDRQRDLNLAKAGLENQLQTSFGGGPLQTKGLSAQGKNLAQTIEDEASIKAGAVAIQNLSRDNLRTLADGGEVGGLSQGGAQKAAIQKLAEMQDIAGLERAAMHAAGTELGKFVAQTLDKNYAGVKQKGAHLVEGVFMDNLRGGEAGNAVGNAELDAAMGRAMGSMAPELLATQDGGSLDRISNAINNGDSNSPEIREVAKQLANNTQAMAKVDANRATFINGIKAP